MAHDLRNQKRSILCHV